MDFLFQVDAVVFEHWPVQIGLLVLWTGLYLQGLALTWLYSGLAVYVALILVNIYRHGLKAEVKHLRELYQGHGIFPFLKGFNYSVLLGPLGIILAILLSIFSKLNKQD